MNRREFLANLRDFCVLYGIQGVLSEEVLATAAQPQRLINFVIKYTGGATSKTGAGPWVTTSGGVLSPLAPYAGQLAIPLGLDSKFKAPMNSHASPQVCALSGSMTGFVMRETQYPTGSLKNWSTGGGKSIDVLIGEKLKAQYNTRLPYLLIGNHEGRNQSCTTKTSSWGAGGRVLEAHYSINGLRNEIASKISCQPSGREVYVTRLKALSAIRGNMNVFRSEYLIDQERFANLQSDLQQTINEYNADLRAMASKGPTPCASLAVSSEHTGSAGNRAVFNAKMEAMYNLAIIALRNNVTRSVTFNLYMYETHTKSHYQLAGNNIAAYYEVCRFMQSSIASFIGKLKAQGLYNNTLIFCNAGSCTDHSLHNYENLATYVINGGVRGLRGSAQAPKPVGSLLVDILNKFGINYDRYGGIDHRYGVGRRGHFLG